MSSSNSTRMAVRAVGRGVSSSRKQAPQIKSFGRGRSTPSQVKTSQMHSNGTEQGGTNRLAALFRNARRAPQRSAGRGNHLDNAPRSELSQSVLNTGRPRHRKQQEPQRNPMFGMRNNGRTARLKTEGARKIEDWYSSSVRKEALESMKDFSYTLSEADTEVHRPFAWGDFENVLSQLPEQHWAVPFVQGVVRNLEANPSVSGKEKERILGNVLQTLSNLSTEDERFQDVEA